jgi:hypothetical protein
MEPEESGLQDLLRAGILKLRFEGLIIGKWIW